MEWKWRLIWFCPLSGHSALTDLIIITKPLKPQVSFSSKRRYETHLYSLHAKTTHVKKYLWWGVSSPAVWSSWPHQLSFTPFLKLMVFCLKLKKKGLENVSGGGGRHLLDHLQTWDSSHCPASVAQKIRAEAVLFHRYDPRASAPVLNKPHSSALFCAEEGSDSRLWLTSSLLSGAVTGQLARVWDHVPVLSSTPPPPQWLPAGNCVKKPTLRHFSFVFSLCGCLQVKSAKCKAFKATLEVQSD